MSAPAPDLFGPLPEDLPDLSAKHCRNCDALELFYEWKLVPTGGSLAGAQAKVSARRAVFRTCRQCGQSLEGRTMTIAEMDAAHAHLAAQAVPAPPADGRAPLTRRVRGASGAVARQEPVQPVVPAVDEARSIAGQVREHLERLLGSTPHTYSEGPVSGATAWVSTWTLASGAGQPTLGQVYTVAVEWHPAPGDLLGMRAWRLFAGGQGLTPVVWPPAHPGPRDQWPLMMARQIADTML